ncbi:MAG: signal peptide prediction [Brachymonas sp.]|jgi:hypothetical protein
MRQTRKARQLRRAFFTPVVACRALLLGADVYTALALLLLWAARAQVRYCGGVWLAWGGALPWLLRHHPLGAVAAAAMGRVVVAGDKATLRRHLRHEWVHVRQFVRWGLLFPALYVLELLRQVLRGKSPYWHNIFEREARRNEKR